MWSFRFGRHRSPTRAWHQARFRPAVEALEDRSVASTYYVATTGSDSGPGTNSQPWLTLQKAANSVHAGDTVIVRAGTYRGFTQTTSGTATARITFQADPGVVINTPNTFTNLDGIYLNQAGYITVDGFTITAEPRDGIRAVGGPWLVIRNNTSDNNVLTGILTGFTDDILIENNVFSRSQQDHGIYVGNSGGEFGVRGWLAALDAISGKLLWKDDRSDMACSYSHPVICETAKGPELVVAGTGKILGYNLETGKRQWAVELARPAAVDRGIVPRRAASILLLAGAGAAVGSGLLLVSHAAAGGIVLTAAGLVAAAAAMVLVTRLARST